jgi:CheY-like chemotaxis protein
MHGGTVEAQSGGLGEGSEFSIRLPLANQPPPTPADDLISGILAARRIDSSGYRLLVVDDNQDSATSLAMLLRLQGHEVRIANDGPRAIEHTAELRPDMVLLDLGMPGMDGYETAKRIRQLPDATQIKIVALTGWGQEEDRRRTASAGFDHHLVKPIDLQSIEALLPPRI